MDNRDLHEGYDQEEDDFLDGVIIETKSEGEPEGEDEFHDRKRYRLEEGFFGESGGYRFFLGFLSGILLVLFLGRLVLTNQYLGLSFAEQKRLQIKSLIQEKFLEDVDESDMDDGMYAGMLESLDDDYSVYYNKEEMKALDEATDGAYSGIGASLVQDPETKEITVVQCFEGTPAMESGLKAGDRLTAINHEELKGDDLTTVVSRIKTEKGDTICLTVDRDGETIEFDIERRVIELPTVEGEMLEEKIGYIQIAEFDTVTTKQFSDKVAELQENGMEKLIIDLRDNPGGLLNVVVSMLDQILPEGLIVYTEDKQGNREEYKSDEEHQLKIPMVVLINGNSASASEIFAGAVKDYGIGTLIGEKTFGKGIVQSIYRLSDGTGVKLTVAKYYTPKGNDIHKKGVEPDIELELDLGDADQYSKENDNQLQKAIEVLQEQETVNKATN